MIPGIAGNPNQLFSGRSVELFAAMSPAPTFEQMKIIDRFMRDAWLPVWQKMDAINVRHSYASQPSLVNWRNPAEVSVPTNSPVFVPYSGWQGDGVAAYIAVPTRNHQYKQDDCHVGYCCALDSGAIDANPLVGGYMNSWSSARLRINPRNLANQRFIDVNRGSGFSLTAIDSTILSVAVRKNAASVDLYDGGALTTSFSQNSVNVGDNDLEFREMNTSGNYGNLRISFLCFGASLTASEIAAINDAWIAYRTEMVET